MSFILTISFKIDELESFGLYRASVGDSRNDALKKFFLRASRVLKYIRGLLVALEVRVCDDFPV